jgi:hypothetical protein
MPPNNYDPATIRVNPRSDEDPRCPKCGVEMEPIEMSAEGLSVQQLQLCPNCYLVTWTDQDGPHVRQGVPVRPGENPGHSATGNEAQWLPGEPEEC